MIASFIIVVFAKFVRYLKWVADQYTIGLNQIWLHDSSYVYSSKLSKPIVQIWQLVNCFSHNREMSDLVFGVLIILILNLAILKEKKKMYQR